MDKAEDLQQKALKYLNNKTFFGTLKPDHDAAADAYTQVTTIYIIGSHNIQKFEKY
jgi:hypothetical protein